MKNACLVGTLAVLLAGCGETPSFEREADAPEPPAVEEAEVEIAAAETESTSRASGTITKATIDWEAANADLARRNAAARSIGGEEEETLQIQSGGDPVAVPVLLPTGIVSIQRSGSGPTIRQTEDGYFARYPGLNYDIVVHGTNEIAAAPEDTVIRDEDFDFVDMMDGAQVSLSRYGADYLISFECNGAVGGMSNCITEEEAFEVARGLIISGGR